MTRPATAHVRLRLLRWRDWRFARALAADPTVRAQSFDPLPPSAWRHLRWMWRQILGRSGVAWVITVPTLGTDVGIATLRIKDGLWHAGVALRPASRGKGWGTEAIRLLTAAAGSHPVFADIKVSNVASVRAFVRAGYTSAWARRETEDFLTLYHPCR